MLICVFNYIKMYCTIYLCFFRGKKSHWWCWRPKNWQKNCRLCMKYDALGIKGLITIQGNFIGPWHHYLFQYFRDCPVLGLALLGPNVNLQQCHILMASSASSLVFCRWCKEKIHTIRTRVIFVVQPSENDQRGVSFCGMNLKSRSLQWVYSAH